MEKGVEEQSLSNYIGDHEIAAQEFLNIAIAITNQLLKYHEKNIIYKYISAKNIFILINQYLNGEQSFDVKFKDINEAERTEDIIFYISPELTGRINISVDFRSDLYSLGCLFYEIYTGKILFYDKDVSKVIYNHISKLPGITTQNEDNVISKIILKLLNKNPEDRYPSAYSLIRDLKKSLYMLKEGHSIEDFELDKEYGSSEFKISNKIFGRTKEINQVFNCYEKSNTSNTKVIFIYGESGIGKSSVAVEAGKLIKGEKSYFIKGKFNNDINKPYGAFIQAFTEFVRENLLEKEESIDELKYTIEELLGSNCEALIKLIPIFKLILDKNETESEISIDEKTVNLVTHKLITAIINANRRLTIFIDDLQWADDASLKLIKYLAASVKSDKFLLIIAYRSNEINSKVNEIVENIKANSGTEQISVKPLSKLVIEKLLTESFKFYEEEVEELSSVICDKTGGSPFFIVQFLKLLYNKKYISFNMKNGRWTFNISKIININCTDNVVSYVMENIKRLQGETIRLMTLAACIGNDFDLKFLAKISKKSHADTYIELIPAVNDKFLTIDAGYYNEVDFSDICKGDVIYRFSHDKIRKTLYDINSVEDKMKIHIIIGEYLAENNLYLLEGVKHINIGAQYMEREEKSVKFAKLNYEAGKIALSKAAYADAYEFFEKANEFLDGGDWDGEFRLTFNIKLELLRMEYIRADLEAAEFLVEELLKHSKKISEMRAVYELRIKYNISMNQISKAEQYTAEFLKAVNIDLNFNPSNEEFEIVKNNFKQKIAEITSEEIYSLDKVKDETVKAVLDILSELQWIEYVTKPLVFELILYKSIELSVEYGNSLGSCISYCQYGWLLTAKYKLADRGYEFGELSYKLVQQFNDPYYKARIAFTFGGVINHHKKLFVSSLEYLSKSIKLFSDKGNTTTVGYALIFEGLIKGIITNDLKKYHSYVSENLGLVKSMNFNSGTLIFTELLHYTEKLMDIENETALKAWKDNSDIFAKEKNSVIQIYYFSALIRSQYIFGEFSAAVETGRNAFKIVHIVNGTFQQLEIYEYYCLALSEMYFRAAGTEKDNYLKEFNEAKEQFETWAALSLINYKHKLLLVQAISFSIEGRKLDAIDTYDMALYVAARCDLIEDAAIINEETSKFYFRLENIKIGIFYLKEALYYYEKWGAVFKTNNINAMLQIIYSDNPLFRQKDIAISNNIKTSLYNEINSLDLKAVIDAYTAISIEMELGELLKKLIKILVKNAGAQQGYLLLKSEESLYVEAEYNAEELQQVKILNSENYIGSGKVAESVVNYVVKTKENVILNNSDNNIFVNDPYIKENKPESVLCVPIIYKNKLTGIIYLQNNITSNVFDNNKVKLVTLIGTQAAISIENAIMYKKIKEINLGLEKDVQSSSKLLNEAIEHDKLKNEFFANLSHEFRTPLNLILSAQQMMDLIIGNHTVDENERKIENYNGIMRQNCLRLLRMVNNLIDITKIDAGFFKIDLSNKDIIKIVEDVVLSVVPYVEEQGLKITFDTNVEEKIIACDGDAIERIILNLISNAVKFSKAGSEIFVDIIDNESNILIKVRDTGIGIPKEKQGVVFDRFVQVDKSLSRSREGSGIGLALTKSLVELLGGKIALDSTFGEYSEFTIDLPCKIVAVNDEVSNTEDSTDSVIEKIKIEFSDIYS